MQNMEQFATAVYRAQMSAFIDKGTLDRLRAATANEQQHADDLSARLGKLGGRSSRLGLLFRIAGTLLGAVTTLPGKALLFKADIRVEKRAIRDYGQYLEKVGFDTETVELLHRIIEDEKRHVATWQSSVERLKARSARAKSRTGKQKRRRDK